MKISVEYWDYTCGDGCCYDWGYDVFVDGEKIGQINDTPEELADLLNEYFNTKRNEVAKTILHQSRD